MIVQGIQVGCSAILRDMWQQIKAVSQSPEVAVPVGTLAVALLLLGAVLSVLRPDAALAASIVAGVAAAYGTVISVILSRYFERQRAQVEKAQELERDTRAKKIPVYEDFVGFWLDALFASKTGKKALSEQQIMQGVIEWTKPILMWGSDDVVREWGQLRVQLAEAKPGNFEGLFRFEQFLITLRRDAGYPETNLSRGDLLRLWVNDIDQYILQGVTPIASAEQFLLLGRLLGGDAFGPLVGGHQERRQHRLGVLLEQLADGQDLDARVVLARDR